MTISYALVWTRLKQLSQNIDSVLFADLQIQGVYGPSALRTPNALHAGTAIANSVDLVAIQPPCRTQRVHSGEPRRRDGDVWV